MVVLEFLITTITCSATSSSAASFTTTNTIITSLLLLTRLPLPLYHCQPLGEVEQEVNSEIGKKKKN